MSEPLPIRHPEDLRLPDVDAPRVAAVLHGLNESGRDDFLRELLDAVYEARGTNNLRKLQDTIEAWHRSAIFAAQPSFGDVVESTAQPISSNDEILTADDIRERLGV